MVICVFTLFQLLAKTLSEVNDEEWFLMIGREIGQQIPLYVNSPEEKVSLKRHF